ncbi:MAG TPA: MaoC family dehydratase N-terminal domain-containing protein [Nocardioides sp.]|jgi:acyl dehydratase|uniref:MaoC family dehydratase n=1 Tax=Nocardioides sp. TaxID=35761 RepID=UPI002E30B11C|nr:MaoC family dehydratase N-terminal domain-containing protein [Nocardioides sp.]HEX3930517.1 MaoC family dehydratase N-terminal domain-containing protein [Nocardioides sp.]
MTGVGFIQLTVHNTRADLASIRFWARTIGERNPRYVDASYAPGPGGRPFEAHPCWLYSVHDTCVIHGHPGLVPVLAGTSWSFQRALAPGETVTVAARLLDERIVNGRFGGETPVQSIEVAYLDESGGTVAIAMSTVFGIDPSRSRTGEKFAGWKRRRYTPEELREIERVSDLEGTDDGVTSAVRYLEDVQPGETVAPIVRGPLTSEEITLYLGATRPERSVEEFTADRLAGRVPAFIHPRTGVYETYGAGLIDDDSAQQLGFPAAHDPGTDRISYLASLVTTWMGPAGELRELDVRLTEPHMLGDTSWCRAVVTSIDPASDRIGRVTLTLEVRNQRDQVTAVGEAEVDLPLRVLGRAR